MNVTQSLTIFLSRLGPEHYLVISLQITGVKTEQEINGKKKSAVTAKKTKNLTDLLLNLLLSYSEDLS